MLNALVVLRTQTLCDLTSDSALLHLEVFDRDPRLRFFIETLLRKASMINPRSKVRLPERVIRECCPTLPHTSVFVPVIG